MMNKFETDIVIKPQIKIYQAQKEAREAREELAQKTADCEAMKKQAASLAQEYDRVTAQLQNAENGAGDKKDD